jgi:hypothetical protein
MNMDAITSTARRPYLCAFCGITVAAGERYVRAQQPGGGLLAKKPFRSTCYARLAAAVEKGGR